MKLTQEQKNAITDLLAKEVLYEEKTVPLIDKAIQHIKEVVGPNWVVAYRPVEESPDNSAAFVIANKERVYTITLAPNNFNTEDKEW